MNIKLNDFIVISQKDIVGSIRLLYNLKIYFNPNINYTIVILGYENENLIKLVSNIAMTYYEANMINNIQVVDVSYYGHFSYNFKCYTGIPGMKNVKFGNHDPGVKKILYKDELFTEYYMLNILKEFINRYSITRVYFPYSQYDLKYMSIQDILTTVNIYQDKLYNNNFISEYIFPYINTKIWSMTKIANCKTIISNSCKSDLELGNKFIKILKDNYTLYEYILFDTRETLASLTSLIDAVTEQISHGNKIKIKIIPYDTDNDSYKFKEINELVSSIKDHYDYNNDIEFIDIDTKDKSIYDILSDLKLKNNYKIILPYTSEHGFRYIKDSYFKHDEITLESIYNIIVPNRELSCELCTINTDTNKLCLTELLKKYKYSDNSIIKSIKKSIELASAVDGENLSDEVKEHVKDLYDIFKKDEKEDTDKKSYYMIGGAKLINRLDKEFNKIENSDDTIISKEDYKRIVNSLEDKEDDVKPAKVSVHIENNDDQTEDDTFKKISLQFDKVKEELLLKLYEIFYKELIKEESDK